MYKILHSIFKYFALFSKNAISEYPSIQEAGSCVIEDYELNDQSVYIPRSNLFSIRYPF